MVDKMYKRAKDRKEKLESLEREKKLKAEQEVKGYFRPKVLSSCTSWEKLKRNENKINQRILSRERKRIEETEKAVMNQEKRFEKDNKNTVYARMQNDLEKRRERERKRRQLKKFKDLHYKEYTKLMQDLSSEDEDGPCENCVRHQCEKEENDLSEIVEEVERNSSQHF